MGRVSPSRDRSRRRSRAPTCWHARVAACCVERGLLMWRGRAPAQLPRCKDLVDKAEGLELMKFRCGRERVLQLLVGHAYSVHAYAVSPSVCEQLRAKRTELHQKQQHKARADMERALPPPPPPEEEEEVCAAQRARCSPSADAAAAAHHRRRTTRPRPSPCVRRSTRRRVDAPLQVFFFLGGGRATRVVAHARRRARRSTTSPSSRGCARPTTSRRALL